jgi:hypothetical protein
MQNVGMFDRGLRIYLGVIVSSILIYYNTIWALIGIPIFVTGIAGFCGIYKLLGISTVRPVKKTFS